LAVAACGRLGDTRSMARPARKPIAPNDAAPPKRRSGRPKNDGARVGADELIRRCVSLLDTLPPARLTFSALARHAGVTPALINYYFKDRADLVVAVVRHLIDEVRLERPQAETPSARDDLKTFVRGLIGAHVRHPNFHRLLLEEMLESPTPQSRALFEETTDGGLAMFRDILKQGEVEGVMRPAEARNLYVAIIGMCSFSVTGQPILEHVSPGVSREDLVASYTDDVFRLVIEGLAPA